MAGSRGDALNAIFQSRDHLDAAFGKAERPGDFQNVVPDIGQCVRRERQNARLETDPAADRLFHFGQTDRAHFALRLRQDEIGPQLFQLSSCFYASPKNLVPMKFAGGFGGGMIMPGTEDGEIPIRLARLGHDFGQPR